MEILKLLASLPIISWFLERRRSVLEHDRKVFAELDAILSEERLDLFFEVVAGGAHLPMRLLGEVESYVTAAGRAKNDFLVSRLRSHHDAFVKALRGAVSYFTQRSQMSANPSSELLHFLPHLNIDMYATDMSGAEKFDEEFRSLCEHIDATEVHYRRYRRLVHELLNV